MQARLVRSVVALIVTATLGSAALTDSTASASSPSLAATAAPQATAPPAFVTLCTSLANQFRKRYRLAPLRIDARLTRAAQIQSNYQAARRLMTHDGYGGPGSRITRAGFKWSAYGENVAAGQPSCQAVMGAWFASSGHRSNILNPRLTHVGFGATRGANGVIYWTMDEARSW